SISGQDEENAIIAEFQQERADEYREVVSRTPAFLQEIETERAMGRATYTEVEESDADLERLRTWLRRIRARDYFGAPEAEQARAAVDGGAAPPAASGAEARAAGAPERGPPAKPRAGRRLRATPGK